MDARVRELVKATIPVLREHGVALTTYFYQRMFRHNPELNHLFNRSHSETGKQPTALALSVLAYAENIDDPSVLAPVINLIANKHASIGISAASAARNSPSDSTIMLRMSRDQVAPM